MKLTEREISRLKTPKRYGDGGGLFLDVRKTGFKSWIQRIVVNGKRVDRRLGSYPAMSLAEARATASANKLAVSNGDDPWAKPDLANTGTPTVRDVAERVYAENAPTWTSAKTQAVWRQRLDQYIIPVLGDVPVDQVTRAQVLDDILLPIWHSKAETARRCRMILRMIFGWAVARDLVAYNIAGEGLDGALPRRRGRVNHMRAVDWREVPRVISKMRTSGACKAAKLMFEWQVLTACRPGEARHAKWQDVDVERQVWTIPAESMKSGREHRVPLSDAAMDILDAATDIRDAESDLLFPSPTTSKPISDATSNKVMRGLGIDATAHGFRSSFRDWCAESGEPRELAEAALAHVVGGVEGAYFRSDLFDRRRELMDKYADFVVSG